MPSFIPTIPKPVVSPIDSGTNHVSASSVFAWEDFQAVGIPVPVAWNIIAYGIFTNIAFAFNEKATYIAAILPITYGLVRPVDYAIDAHVFKPGISWNDLVP